MNSPIAALFVRADSVYKRMPGVDAWDAERDARLYDGPYPVVAHPPCRLWSCMKHFARAPIEEKELAHFSIRALRRFGGVLEHPRGSSLWKEAQLPQPGEVDEWGGYSIIVEQFWWGHKAEKKTLLYIVGCPLDSLPTVPVRFGEPTHVIDRPSRVRKAERNRKHPKPWVTKAEREHTPPRFCRLAGGNRTPLPDPAFSPPDPRFGSHHPRNRLTPS